MQTPLFPHPRLIYRKIIQAIEKVGILQHCGIS